MGRPDSDLLTNKAGEQISPATEEKQDDIILAVTPVLDTNNSTATPLGIGGEFKPTNGTDVSGYNNVVIQLYSDQDSAIDGMVFEFSTDDVNWDKVDVFELTGGNNAREFQFACNAKYFRINYTNGGVAQNDFRVQTLLKTSSIITSIHRAKDSITEDNSLQLMKAVVTGRSDVTGNFENIKSLNGALNVHDADVHAKLVNHYADEEIGAVTTLNGAVSKGDVDIVVTDATDIVVGDVLELDDGTEHIHLYRHVTVVVGTTITLDAPLPRDLVDGSEVVEVLQNMAVDGSGTTRVFSVFPAAGEVWHITRLLFEIVHGNAAADDKFGSITALTNGVHLRVSRNNGADDFEDLTTWKANKDMKEDMHDVTYSDKAGGANHGTNGRWMFTRMGGIIRLDGDNGDSLQMLIQDNLTALIDFQIKLQGHFENA